jgi:secondary thiamine-phosphate synthase enzyme
MFKMQQFKIEITTPGRKLINITDEIAQCLAKTTISTGLCHVFLHHTSASLSLCENNDPLVLKDLETFMLRLIPDGDPVYQHTEEGDDDMPSHIRSVLTQSFLSLPISNKKLALGKWQGVYLWEHRYQSHERKITLTLMGDDVI